LGIARTSDKTQENKTIRGHTRRRMRWGRIKHTGVDDAIWQRQRQGQWVYQPPPGKRDQWRNAPTVQQWIFPGREE
jgi:hypothetical protein